MKHLRWIVPLVLTFAIYLACAAALTWISGGGHTSTAWALVGALVSLLGLVGSATSIVFAIVGGVKVFRAWLRSRGILTRSERSARDFAALRGASADASWRLARELRTTLMGRKTPSPIPVWDVVPRPNEVMFLDVPATYARYYGTDVAMTSSSTLVLGRPAFVLAGLAASAISQAAAARQAATAAQAQWREWQTARVVVTNQRIVCNVGGQWLSFDYPAIDAVYPEVSSWTLVCQFGDVAAPLLLAGDSSPAISVITVLMTHGEEGLRDHPSLKPLDVSESPSLDALKP